MTRNIALLGGVAMLLSGCAGAPIIYNRHQTTYSPGEYSYAGYVYLDVRGNPYNVPTEQLQAAVADAMTGGTWGVVTPFVTNPPQPATSPYKVVMVFDAPWYASYDRMCQQPDTIKPLAPSGNFTHVTAALCRSNETVTYVYAGFGVTGPNDPNFRSAIRQVEVALLPARNEHIDQGGNGGGQAGDRGR